MRGVLNTSNVIFIYELSFCLLVVNIVKNHKVFVLFGENICEVGQI